MKLTSIFILLFTLSLSAHICAQTVSLNLKNVSFSKALEEISKQTKFDFSYNDQILQQAKSVTLRLQNEDAERALEKLFATQPFTYEVSDHIIIIKAKPNRYKPEYPANPETSQQSGIKGKVLGSRGKPLMGASIYVLDSEGKRSSQQTRTDENGNFELAQAQLGVTIELSFLGYVSQRVQLVRSPFVVTLQEAAREIQTVEVNTVNTGMFERSKETFTGATQTISGDKLRQVGNTNVIQSLRSLDPSFIVMENNLAGSNPNALANIELRGKSSVGNDLQNEFSGNANLPLFILNGFPSSLQQITDIDINRIASVTLLKDAASTAIYGGRAANGVVVVETIRPKAGELTFNFTDDARFELTNLSGYNMMNASQLLEFQKLSLVYDPVQASGGLSTMNSVINAAALYQARLKNVLNGVNSYWLDAPLRDMGYSLNNNVAVNGGSENFMFNINLNYRKENGVMKGSGRNTWGASSDITYRRNKLNFTNRIYVSGYKANESPYGSFSQYVSIAPYFKRYLDDGSLNTNKYLEEFVSSYASNGGLSPDNTFRTENPLYNATLNSLDQSTLFSVQDNLNMIWDISKRFRFMAGGQIGFDNTNGINFMSPQNTIFDDVDVTLRGKYTNNRLEALNYTGNISLAYNQSFNKKHTVVANIRAEAIGYQNRREGYTAVGFPDNSLPNPFYAREYELDARPDYYKDITRSANVFGSANYAYDNKYYADATFRVEGSSIFGQDNRYTSFWSLGLGWNLHKESFLSDLDYLTTFRLRGNFGYTGNQSIGQYTTNSIYSYDQMLNLFGSGYVLSQAGIKGLTWQNTAQLSLGTDISLWADRLNLVFDYYHKLTDPLIIPSILPPSSGVDQTYVSLGALSNRGVEWRANFSPIYRRTERIIWTIGLTGAVNKTAYKNVESTLSEFNDPDDVRAAYRLGSALSENQMQRYVNGYSPDDLWAVKSLGIDPMSGRELFQKKDGTSTFIFNYDDMVRVGNSLPSVQGVISTNLNYKGFLFNAYLRYSLGSYTLNNALYQKVENIDFNDLRHNQDVRALDLRWKEVGDVSQFKAIKYTEYTPMSSRFLQKQNIFSGESISVGYEFRKDKHPFMKRINANTIRINILANDIFRLSNVRAERGINYPYARTVSTSLSLFF